MSELLSTLQERALSLRIHAHTAINIAGLAIALCAALCIVLIIRVEQTYDTFLPDHSRIYRVNTIATPPGQEPTHLAGTIPALAGWMRTDLGQSIELVGRFVSQQNSLRRGDVEAMQRVVWADPEALRVMPFASIAGDIRTALDRPDGIVLTRALAQRFFGRDTPLGEMLTVDGEHPMIVTAVIEDLPKTTHLDIEVIGSALAKFSRIAQLDASPRVIANVAATYVKLRAGVSPETVERALTEVFARHDSSRSMQFTGPRPRRSAEQFDLIPIPDIHLDPNSGGGMNPQGSSGSQALLVALATIGGLIVLTATFNYVNLMTARGALRAIEVGVRKSFGARRRELIFQFMFESVAYVAIAAVLAIMLFLLVRTRLNTLLEAGIPADLWRDPKILLACVGATLAIGVLAAIYPAFVLSAFRPAAVLRGGPVANASSGAIRQALIAAQLAVLVGLLIGTAYIYRQARFALYEAFPIDNSLVMTVGIPMGPCNKTLRDEIRALPGVSGAACTLGAPFGNSISNTVQTPRGETLQLYQHQVDFDFFDIYGIRPVAGRLFSRERAEADSAPTASDSPREAPLILNETAVRRLGFASSAEAVGKTVSWSRLTGVEGRFGRYLPSEVIGVVRDFPHNNVRARIDPTVYFIDPSLAAVIHVKLNDKVSVERSLSQIDALWKRLGPPRPIARRFVEEILEQRYAALTRQTQAFGAFSAVALFIAALGLFGLSAFATERRIREVGIRKALGARRLDIVRQFLWEFTKPVLWAALIALPVAYIFTRRWLDGFAFRVDLDPHTFVGAALLAWIVACATVLFHVLRAAQSRPVESLRYE